MEVRTIDFVVPMVFHDDPQWQEDFKKVRHRYDENNLYDFVRYRSWGTEDLLIRCIRKFMPFVRTIYIILARESQKRDWMDEEGVKIVYHRDFISEKFLPTFGLTFEMFLHKIPGLSERFIYGNDDIFPLAPLTEQDFFEGDVPCIHNTEKPYPEHPNIFHMFCIGGLNFIAREFGMRYRDTFLKGGHGLTPMLKSTWEHLWNIGAKEIEASITPFREGRNFNQWICPWWHWLSGNYVDRIPSTVYVNVSSGVDKMVKAIQNSTGIVCVNDNECEKDYKKYAVAVRAAIEEKLKS